VKTHRLSYVTSALLKPGSAQAMQIISMARAFNAVLGSEFQLVSCRSPLEAASFPFAWKQMPCFLQRRGLRYAELAARAAVAHRGFRGMRVFTRDIGIAALLDALGARVTYEMHHDFRTALGARVFAYLRDRIRFVAISAALRQYMVREHGVPESRILVAHDGVFLERYDAVRTIPRAHLRAELGIPEDRFVLMHTGSLFKGRGIEFFEPVLREVPEAACICVGGTEADIVRWRRHYAAYPQIRFLPHQPQDTLVRYQMAADALFFPMTKDSSIWWCTSPLKLFEYLATGVPIVGTAIGSAAEVLNESNSVGFDADAPESAVSAVRWAMHNPVAARARAREGLELVTKHYTWQVRAQRIVEFVEAAC